jgi:glycine cleavage system H protein
MNKLPEDLSYTESHEWLKNEGNHIFQVGITDYAQKMLGDLVYIDLPALHRKVEAGEETAVVESVKTAADVYSPIEGEIIEVNPLLKDAPELVNQDPYEKGWLFRVKTTAEPSKSFLTAESYRKQTETE